MAKALHAIIHEKATAREADEIFNDVKSGKTPVAVGV